MATLRGDPVDRPPVCFYEINGFDENPLDKDPFNIYSHPSWQPLIELARDKTDRIVMRGIAFQDRLPDPIDDIAEVETIFKTNSRYSIKSVRIGGKQLTARTRQDTDVNTVWTEEPLLKNLTDVKNFLDVPLRSFSQPPDISAVLQAELELGESGIVMIDTPDPLCLAASLFDLSDFMIFALTEHKLFHQLLEKFAAHIQPQTEAVADLLPGRHWRIYGPEYASPPYLPPVLFNEYVVCYDKPMVSAIHKQGGFARLHSHGKLKNILDLIVATGCMGLDPIEPPPQGDVELKYVRDNYGRDLVLFGNLEICDIENLPTSEFAKKVTQTLTEGTAGQGKGFVLMPSACPYGRVLSNQALKNYEKMVEMVETF